MLSGSSGAWVLTRIGENDAPGSVPPRMWENRARPYPLWPPRLLPPPPTGFPGSPGGGGFPGSPVGGGGYGEFTMEHARLMRGIVEGTLPDEEARR